jgi:hypothetical protein
MFIKNPSYGVDHLPSSVSDAGGFLQFYSFILDELLSFEAFLTSYSDSFNSNWNSETVFGRVDPILTFQNTQRTMGLSFTIPNVVARKGISGPTVTTMDQLNKFFQFLYPGYSGPGPSALTISQAPLVRIKFGNMISNSSVTSVGSAASDGLLAAITSLTMNPQIEHGFSTLTTQLGQKLIYPNFVDLSLSINAIHEEKKFFLAAGSTTDEQGREVTVPSNEINMNFPYGGFGLQKTFDIVNEAIAPIDTSDLPPSLVEGVEGLLPASTDNVIDAYGLPNLTTDLGSGGDIDNITDYGTKSPQTNSDYYEDTWEKQEGPLGCYTEGPLGTTWHDECPDGEAPDVF